MHSSKKKLEEQAVGKLESAKSSGINSGSNKINLTNVADDQLASMFRPLTCFFLGSIFKIVSNKIVCLSFLLGLFTHGTRVKTGFCVCSENG